MYKKIIRLLIICIIISLLFICNYKLLNKFEKKIPIANNGTITINNKDLNNKFLPLKGNFKVYEGIISPDKINTLNTNYKLMSLEDLRVYSYPNGTATATLHINLNNTSINGIIIEEIYSANKIFINNKLLCKTGKIGTNKKNTLKEKNSHLIYLNQIDKSFDLTIQIANFEQISGQFKRNIYIGNYNYLHTYYKNNLIIKYIQIIFYFTTSLFLLTMYLKNKKYTYLLTLALAGFFNSYIILTHFEPIVFFKPTGFYYYINSIVNTLPTLLVQFFSALTVILFFKQGIIYKNIKTFIFTNGIIFSIVITLLVIFDETATPIYLLTLFYVIGILIYSFILSIKIYIYNKKSSFFIFLGLSFYLFTYFTLVNTTLSSNNHQTIEYYTIYLLLGQILFYGLISYIAISDYSHSFSLSQLEEKKLENIIKTKTKELENSYNKLLIQDKQRKQILTDISHDLRSPITVVKGYIELLKNDQINKKDYKKYFDIIYLKINYVSDLISELFLLINLETTKNFHMEDEYLYIIINTVVNSFHNPNISIDINKNILLHCNDKQIYRLFNNLIENALTHGGNNCSIKIISYINKNNNLIIQVIDNGKGILKNDIPYIFDRFTRTDKSRNLNKKHFGLGLSICKAIVENHNGTITCDSIKNKKTTFTITFRGDIYENFNS